MAAPTLNYTYPGKTWSSGLSWSLGIKNLAVKSVMNRHTLSMMAIATSKCYGVIPAITRVLPASSYILTSNRLMTISLRGLRVKSLHTLIAFRAYPTAYFSKNTTYRPIYGEQWPRFAVYGSVK